MSEAVAAIKITLPDGSKRTFDEPVTGLALAEGIGRGLARDAVAVRVDGELRDLSRMLEDDAAVELVTRDSDEGLEILAEARAAGLGPEETVVADRRSRTTRCSWIDHPEV